MRIFVTSSIDVKVYYSHKMVASSLPLNPQQMPSEVPIKRPRCRITLPLLMSEFTIPRPRDRIALSPITIRVYYSQATRQDLVNTEADASSGNGWSSLICQTSPRCVCDAVHKTRANLGYNSCCLWGVFDICTI